MRKTKLVLCLFLLAVFAVSALNKISPKLGGQNIEHGADFDKSIPGLTYGEMKTLTYFSQTSERFKVMQTVNCGAKAKGEWYHAVPPLTRCNTGLSPADYFGRIMLENSASEIKIGIINVSVGGCKIELFERDSYQTYVQESPDWLKNTVKQYDGNPYGRLIEMAKIAQKQGVIKGILMHQGESNNGDSTWPTKVKKVYDNIHADLQLAPNTLPLLAGELVNFDQNGACAGMNAIIATLKDYIPKAHVVASQGCEGVPDRLHFSAAGYRELGRRYAATMLSINKK